MSFGSGYDYQNIPQPKLDKDKETSDDTFPSDHLPTPSNEPNTLGCFYEWILNSTIIFAACAFVISLLSYFTADNPIAEQINMGTLLISGTFVFGSCEIVKVFVRNEENTRTVKKLLEKQLEEEQTNES